MCIRDSYDTVKNSLINAFMQSALTQQILGPFLDTLSKGISQAYDEAGNFQVGQFMSLMAQPIKDVVSGIEGLQPVFSAFAGIMDTIKGAFGIVDRTEGYASGGIASGPESGYFAKLHGTEAIIPLNGSSPMGKTEIHINCPNAMVVDKNMAQELAKLIYPHTKKLEAWGH